MDIKSFHEPESGTWTHLLADVSSKIAAIIDPVWVYDPVSGMVDSGFIEAVLAATSCSAKPWRLQRTPTAELAGCWKRMRMPIT